MTKQRVRIRFSKTGDLKLISHRDLVRAFERLFRRAGVELAMSQGFHPRPLMTFPDALALGTEGQDEVMDLTLATTVDDVAFQALLNEKCPNGLTINSVELLSDQQRKVKMQKASYELRLPHEESLPTGVTMESLKQGIQAFKEQDKLVVQRKDKQVELNLEECLDGLWLEALTEGSVPTEESMPTHTASGKPSDNRLLMSIRVVQKSQLQPKDILVALGLEDLLRQGATLTRTKIELVT